MFNFIMDSKFKGSYFDLFFVMSFYYNIFVCHNGMTLKVSLRRF